MEFIKISDDQVVMYEPTEIKLKWRCSTCKWWGGTPQTLPDYACPCEKYGEQDYKAEIVSYSDDPALYTLSEFGCVHWESK